MIVSVMELCEIGLYENVLELGFQGKF